VSLTITRLGHRGEGIADGPVYIPRTLPGEVVEGDVVDGRVARPKIQSPSPDRVAAFCVHYKSCGGCALMHARDEFVSSWKRDVVVAALAAQGIDAEVLAPVTSPPRSRRRAVLTGRRLKSGPVVGFHAPASDVVTPISDCHLLAPDLMKALPACADLTARFGSRKGALRFHVVTSSAGVDLDMEGATDPDGPARIDLAEIAGQHDLARLSVSGEVIVERRPPAQRFGAASVVPPPGAFLQATREGEECLVTAALRGLGRAERVVDLFSGCGTFSLPIAKHAEVHAVETDPAMLAALDSAWRKAESLKRVSTEARDLFRRPLEPDELRAFDAVIIDPPRAGAEAQMQRLAASDVSRVVSISCNPVTFARDAKILCDAGFGMGAVQVVDQFRWSPHVELVTTLTRPHMPGKT
jgi:23S rRNA (uracil1939-C5)-methyltransferase